MAPPSCWWKSSSRRRSDSLASGPWRLDHRAFDVVARHGLGDSAVDFFNRYRIYFISGVLAGFLFKPCIP
jgi:hypothetical protein